MDGLARVRSGNRQRRGPCRREDEDAQYRCTRGSPLPRACWG